MPTMASTTYPATGAETRVSGLPGFPAGGAGGGAPWAGMGLLDRLIARRLADYEAEADRRARMGQLAEERAKMDLRTVRRGEEQQGPRYSYDPLEREQRSAQRAAFAQARGRASQPWGAGASYAQPMSASTGMAMPGGAENFYGGLGPEQTQALRISRAGQGLGHGGGVVDPFDRFAAESEARRRLGFTGRA